VSDGLVLVDELGSEEALLAAELGGNGW